MNLLAQIAADLSRRCLVRSADRILVAVSGGADSMVLLTLLHQLCGKSARRLIVAHFNHGLRGRASDADERLVRRVTESMGLKFVRHQGDVAGFAKQHGISIEMAARELRHQFLSATARRRRCGLIATGHHADDQVELFFLRLIRGAGGEGLSGMKWRTPAPKDSRVFLIRPLLGTTKTELLAHAQEQQIPFREDATNATSDALRNRVRLELLPLLRTRFQPALNRTVLRAMDLIGAAAQVVEDQATQWLAEQSANWPQLPLAVQRAVLRRQLLKLQIGPEFEVIESLRTRPEVPVTVAPEIRVLRDTQGRVQILTGRRREFSTAQKNLNLRRAGAVSFGGGKLRWETKPGTLPIPKNKQLRLEFFDADAVGRQAIVRFWQPGDRFHPIGMNGAVKLQDWFTNRKIPVARRRELLVATTPAGHIFWVEDQRIGETFKVTAKTRRVLKWQWTR